MLKEWCTGLRRQCFKTGQIASKKEINTQKKATPSILNRITWAKLSGQHEKLQFTSEKLKISNEKLKFTAPLLKFTSTKLLNTSIKSESTTDKFANSSYRLVFLSQKFVSLRVLVKNNSRISKNTSEKFQYTGEQFQFTSNTEACTSKSNRVWSGKFTFSFEKFLFSIERFIGQRHLLIFSSEKFKICYEALAVTSDLDGPLFTASALWIELFTCLTALFFFSFKLFIVPKEVLTFWSKVLPFSFDRLTSPRHLLIVPGKKLVNSYVARINHCPFFSKWQWNFWNWSFDFFKKQPLW